MNYYGDMTQEELMDEELGNTSIGNCVICKEPATGDVEQALCCDKQSCENTIKVARQKELGLDDKGYCIHCGHYPARCECPDDMPDPSEFELPPSI